MQATQHIFRVRRQYNQWVANQTLEDYALRFTAKSARRWSLSSVAITALGATAFLALEAIGGTITLHYGFYNAIIAMLTVGLIIFVTGLPISYYAAKHGLDIDLLTCGAGFGYLGSTVTSLIYASFTFIFFAIEAAILAMALKALFGIPVSVGYVLCALAVVPIVTHGITVISKFQVGTQPIWLILQCIALAAVIHDEANNFIAWTHFQGTVSETIVGSATNAGAEFNVLLFGAAASVLFALVAQIGEQVDYLRFLPPQESTTPLRWWSALLFAGPGWISIGIVKMLFGSFLAYLAFSQGISETLAADPTHMYQMAFSYFTHSPTPALILAGIMVIISQMKINVTNAYAGSIAWSNFFSRLTHSHPGRVVWLGFNVLIALLLMELGIYLVLENILGLFAIVAISWLGSISADLMINKTLGLSPPGIEFKRAHLYDINPVGVGSMFTATIIGLLCYLSFFGPVAQALAHFISLGTTFLMVPLIAFITDGKYYIARPPEPSIDSVSSHVCCICENEFESEDISHCPAYQGSICSLCCSLDARCKDICKDNAQLSEQVRVLLGRVLPAKVVALIDSSVTSFVVILLTISLINAGLFAVVYYHIAPTNPTFAPLLFELLWTLYFVMLIISGVLAWLFLLSHESRNVAQEESNKQNHLLQKEIEAHRETDLELQGAKDIAESANLAKSRYLTGISHELRTPLQSILGYAQLLSRDESIPKERKETLNIMRRSGEHLADLIEGLLDISRIEAGRISIRRDQVDLHGLLSQLVSMFSMQAQSKSVVFNYHCNQALPKYVVADEKRLRQILINLLSNAVKFTETGSVSLTINYRNQVAEFIVKDTGVGIETEDINRIFKPFERVTKPNVPRVPGTGLGLTIVRLLSEVMGGNITVESSPGKGSTFSVMLMLSPVSAPILQDIQRPAIGYHGERKTVLVVDDEPTHRSLISDLLSPLGFTVMEAQSAECCLEEIEHCLPDIFLVDVSMPGMDGLELSKQLRRLGHKQPIIMVSADAEERHTNPADQTAHNAYMVKPIRLHRLLENFTRFLDIDWVYNDGDLQPETEPPNMSDISFPKAPDFSELSAYAEIGYAKGFKEKLKKMMESGSYSPQALQYLETLSGNMDYEKIAKLLKEAS